ncbi:unnamed protein product [Pseudo-nitzschia multistriata]|uniref:Uncharacterized protein n=1 Tax=Pseudo-nitzschia multistriata TaxID=183589 RepID=A0A448ZDX5_9STRA|nr:unnamed protein product [Pseudo-nitzschia multistriata]
MHPGSEPQSCSGSSGLNINDFIKTHYGAISGMSSNGETAQEDTVTLSLLAANAKDHARALGVACSETASLNSGYFSENDSNSGDRNKQQWTLRRLALELSLWLNVFITLTKAVAYFQTLSLSVLAALLDSVLDVVSQMVLNYTEKHSSLQRSSALYPAGASRLEPIGVLTCASLMGMASFEVLKESFETLYTKDSSLQDLDWTEGVRSAASMGAIVVLKLLLLWLCNYSSRTSCRNRQGGGAATSKSLRYSDPTLEAVAQDHWNDALSNGVSAVCLLLALYTSDLWWCDGVGAILISFYIIYSWYETGKEQIEHLTGKSAPDDFLEELTTLAQHFDDRLLVDTCRAYHFGPKFLVELEVVMPMDTPLKESHDLGMELQYEIEARGEVERCFVHIDYESREYDEHVVSKVPELREHLLRHRSSRNNARGTALQTSASSV